jgi:hypothetical protein
LILASLSNHFIFARCSVIGLYFNAIDFLANTIPIQKTKLIYIGMSEKRTNSISTRLLGHYDGKSGNMAYITIGDAIIGIYLY